MEKSVEERLALLERSIERLDCFLGRLDHNILVTKYGLKEELTQAIEQLTHRVNHMERLYDANLRRERSR